MVSGMINKAMHYAAQIVSSTIRPPYMPLVLYPDSVAAAQRLREDADSAREMGYKDCEKLLLSGDKNFGLTVEDFRSNMEDIVARFNTGAAKADPDALAVLLIELFCVGIPDMAVLDNRRRVVTVWSAILAPTVVIRERDAKPITVDGVLEAGHDWLEKGYTEDAKSASKQSRTNFISAHPARAYQLVADSAMEHCLDHETLMLSMLKPVMLSIETHMGALAALNDAVGHKPSQGENQC